jgi:hypothetical protein
MLQLVQLNCITLHMPHSLLLIPLKALSIFASPNVVVEWLTLLLRIREISGSNLGPKTGYPD